MQAYSKDIMKAMKEKQSQTFSETEVKLMTFSSFNAESLKSKVIMGCCVLQ